MQTFVLFSTKNFGYFKIYCASTWTRGGSANADILGQMGLIFCNLVRTSFMDGYFKMTTLLALNLKKVFFEVYKTLISNIF